MTQKLEFPIPQGETVDVRLLAHGTDTIGHTASSVTGKTNDATLVEITDVPDAFAGVYRVSAVLAGTTDVAYGGYAKFSGVANALHVAEQSYASLTQANPTLAIPSAAVAASLVGSAIRWTRGQDNTVVLTGLGDLTGYSAIYFTAKENLNQADSTAWVQLKLDSGGTSTLLYMGGAAAGVGETGTITVDDLVAGDITITLNAVASQKLVERSGEYDVKKIETGSILQMTAGEFSPLLEVTRAVA